MSIVIKSNVGCNEVDYNFVNCRMCLGTIKVTKKGEIKEKMEKMVHTDIEI